MYIFLSYAREDRQLAERVRGTLAAAGFDCFLDTESLPPGQEFNARIGRAIDRADLFIVLLSAPALEPGSYVMTELAFAERKWRNPAGFVLPVAAGELDYGTLPAYLEPVNVFRPRGNVEAEILAWVQERVEKGGGGADDTPEQRLARWRRLHQPPLRRERRLPARFIAGVAFGLAFIAFGLVASSFGSSGGPTPPGFEMVRMVLTVIPALVGAGTIVYSIVQLIRALLGASPVAALVLDRNEGKNGLTVHLLVEGDRRRSCTAVGRTASAAYPGDIGWAFIASGMLLGFERG
jgi:hypothetical protein